MIVLGPRTRPVPANACPSRTPPLASQPHEGILVVAMDGSRSDHANSDEDSAMMTVCARDVGREQRSCGICFLDAVIA